MKEIEALLQQDRAAGVPQPPDARYTVAAINRRLGRPPVAQSARRESDWLPVPVALCLTLVAFLYFGLNPWFLAAMLIAALCTTPILLRKGA
ncbi:MAG TPA: hypothetical protein VK191_12425 [Symbiobacteriaceae bacterium]|nr:hypothetical protein [Symbiobacteriaceae bacterium]